MGKFKTLSELFKKDTKLVENLENENKIVKKVNGWPLILGYLGIFFFVFAGIILLPLLISIFYHQEINHIFAFLIPGISSLIIGSLLSILLRKKEKTKLGKYQDLILLILIWLCGSLICSVPFMISKKLGGLGFTFPQAIFETVSGFSTTGLTVLTEEINPTYLLMNNGKTFLFYRSVLMLFGGIGFVLILTCVISDVSGMKLYYNEGHTDRLLPNLYHSAKLILGIYLALIIIGSVALWLGGMNSWTEIKTPIGCENEPTTSSYFEALCFSMTTLSTGGFATRTLGIYSFNNVAIEIITIVLMIIGGSNFLIIYSLLTFKFKKVKKDIDVKVMFIFTLIFIPLLIITSLVTPTINGTYLSFKENIRYNVFHFFTCLTTTGASNVSNIKNIFSIPSIGLIIFIMACGCQQGSTCSGIKLYRVGVCIKSLIWTIKEKNSNENIIYPHYIYKFGETKEVDDKETKEIYAYIVLYFLLIIISSFLIAIFVHDNFNFLDCFFEVTSAISSTGLSSGIASFSQHPIVLIILSIIMFIGRLEIFTFIYSAIRIFNDIKSLFFKNKKRI